MLVAQLLRPGEILDGKVAFLPRVLWITADMGYAVALKELKMLIIRRAALTTKLHQSALVRGGLSLVAVYRDELGCRSCGGHG